APNGMTHAKNLTTCFRTNVFCDFWRETRKRARASSVVHAFTQEVRNHGLTSGNSWTAGIVFTGFLRLKVGEGYLTITAIKGPGRKRKHSATKPVYGGIV